MGKGLPVPSATKPKYSLDQQSERLFKATRELLAFSGGWYMSPQCYCVGNSLQLPIFLGLGDREVTGVRLGHGHRIPRIERIVS